MNGPGPAGIIERNGDILFQTPNLVLHEPRQVGVVMTPDGPKPQIETVPVVKTWKETSLRKLVQEAVGSPSFEQRYNALRAAVSRVYFAAHWYPDRECDHVGLWDELREAAGFSPGHKVEVLGSARYDHLPALSDKYADD